MIRLASINFFIIWLIVIFGFALIQIAKNHLQD